MCVYVGGVFAANLLSIINIYRQTSPDRGGPVGTLARPGPGKGNRSGRGMTDKKRGFFLKEGAPRSG